MTPGDQLRIEVEVLSMKTRAGRILGKAFVDGNLACQATLTCQVVPRVREPLPGTTVETTDAQVAVAQEGASIPAPSSLPEPGFRTPALWARFRPLAPR